MITQQLELPEVNAGELNALNYFADSDLERGEVFTRREVVEFVLDLTGWTTESDLRQARLLEPSAGSGDFLIPAIERLLDSNPPIDSLPGKIQAVEVHRASFLVCRARIDELLEQHGISEENRTRILGAWLINDDFLTTELSHGFTHVVGNPPYVRQEALPNDLLKVYRKRYNTMYDRADLYVPFFERSLSLLKDEGRLGFICANRWTKNKYGGPLRKFVSDRFHLESYIDFTGCPAFHDEVVAYPAVTVIARRAGINTRIAHRPEVSSATLRPLAAQLLSNESFPNVNDAQDVVSGSSPWLVDNPARLAVIRRLERQHCVLEEAGCKVGIGVATGADKIFIGSDNDLAVEADRKLPIAMTRDIKNGEIAWSGKMVLNPFLGDTPDLVELDDYPEFAEYINRNKEAICGRHVAKSNPKRWFKTIDRIYPSLKNTPKLLIPDIKGEPTVVYDAGQFYPHHNFYYVTSETWNLHALQAVLLSPVAQSFIATYSLRMRGDFLRYQAQYLRRIRIPHWNDVSNRLQEMLIVAGEARDQALIQLAVQELYDIDDVAWQLLYHP